MGPPKSVPPNVIVGGSDLPLKNLAMIYRYLQLQWILMIFSLKQHLLVVIYHDLPISRHTEIMIVSMI